MADIIKASRAKLRLIRGAKKAWDDGSSSELVRRQMHEWFSDQEVGKIIREAEKARKALDVALFGNVPSWLTSEQKLAYCYGVISPMDFKTCGSCGGSGEKPGSGGRDTGIRCSDCPEGSGFTLCGEAQLRVERFIKRMGR